MRLVGQVRGDRIRNTLIRSLRLIFVIDFVAVNFRMKMRRLHPLNSDFASVEARCIRQHRRAKNELRQKGHDTKGLEQSGGGSPLGKGQALTLVVQHQYE